MTTQVIDYSDIAPPTPASIAAGGYDGVVRYCVPGNLKSITATEYRRMTTAGLTVTLVYEGSAGQILNGHTQGVHDAAQALRHANNLGVQPRAIYFACDVDAQPDQYAQVDAYLTGAASVLGAARVGLYAGRQVIEHCRITRTAAWLWQTAAWGTGLAANIHLYQRVGAVTVGGTPCDVNDVHKIDYGQHPAPTIVPAPPVKEWFQMPLDPTAKADIRAVVYDALNDFLGSKHFKNAIVAFASEADLGVVRKEGISGSTNVAKKAVAAIKAAAVQAEAELAKLEAYTTPAEPAPAPAAVAGPGE